MAHKNEISKLDRSLILSLAVVALLVILFWVTEMQTLLRGPSYGDEGFVAEAARRIFRGEVPYRDFFNGVTPGSYYFYALLFKLFGSSFFALRLGVVLTAGMILLGVWWALRCFGMRTFVPFVMAAAYLAYYAGPYWFVASYHWLSAALCLLSLGLLLGERDDPARCWKIAAAGGLATLVAFTLQHKGVLWILAVTIALLTLRPEERRLALLWFWGGILAVALPLVIGFVSVVGWDTLITDLITFPLSQYHKVEGHRGGTILEFLGQSWSGVRSSWRYREHLVDWVRILAWHAGFLGALVLHLLPVLGTVALITLWREKCISKRKLTILTAFFIASYLAALHRLSDTTLGFAAPAAVLTIVLALHVGCDRIPSTKMYRLRRWATGGWLILFITVVLAYGVLGVLTQKVTTQTPAGPVDSIVAGHAETMEGVMAFMRDNRQPGEKIFCYPYLAIFYFLLQADNPTPYDLLTYPMSTQEQLDHAQALLEADHTRWVLWNHTSLETDSFGKYLTRNYEVRAKFKYVSVMERRETR